MVVDEATGEGDRRPRSGHLRRGERAHPAAPCRERAPSFAARDQLEGMPLGGRGRREPGRDPWSAHWRVPWSRRAGHRVVHPPLGEVGVAAGDGQAEVPRRDDRLPGFGSPVLHRRHARPRGLRNRAAADRGDGRAGCPPAVPPRAVHLVSFPCGTADRAQVVSADRDRSPAANRSSAADTKRGRLREDRRDLPEHPGDRGWQRAQVGHPPVGFVPHHRASHLRHLSPHRGRGGHRGSLRVPHPVDRVRDRGGTAACVAPARDHRGEPVARAAVRDVRVPARAGRGGRPDNRGDRDGPRRPSVAAFARAGVRARASKACSESRTRAPAPNGRRIPIAKRSSTALPRTRPFARWSTRLFARRSTWPGRRALFGELTSRGCRDGAGSSPARAVAASFRTRPRQGVSTLASAAVLSVKRVACHWDEESGTGLLAVRSHCRRSWCRRRDSNSHALAGNRF